MRYRYKRISAFVMLASFSIQAAPWQACLWRQGKSLAVAYVYFMHAKDNIYTFLLFIVCCIMHVIECCLYPKGRETSRMGKGSVLWVGASFQLDFAASTRRAPVAAPLSFPLHTHNHNAHDIKDIALAATKWPAVPALAPAAAMPPRFVLPPHKKDAARPARPFIHQQHWLTRPHHLQSTFFCAKCLPYTFEVLAQGRPATPPAHSPPTHRLHRRIHILAASSATNL